MKELTKNGFQEIKQLSRDHIMKMLLGSWHSLETNTASGLTASGSMRFDVLTI